MLDALDFERSRFDACLLGKRLLFCILHDTCTGCAGLRICEDDDDVRLASSSRLLVSGIP